MLESLVKLSLITMTSVIFKTMFRNAAAAVFLKILKFFFIKIKYDLYVLDRFDVLMSKIIFKK